MTAEVGYVKKKSPGASKNVMAGHNAFAWERHQKKGWGRGK